MLVGMETERAVRVEEQGADVETLTQVAAEAVPEGVGADYDYDLGYDGPIPDVDETVEEEGEPTASERAYDDVFGWGQGKEAGPPGTGGKKTPAAPKVKEEPKGPPGKALTDKTYLAKKTFGNGASLTSQPETSADEAKILNELRKSTKRLSPKYLAELQTTLGVTNNRGAFNTETLRKLKDRHANLTTAMILNGDILTAIHPGKPFVDVATGFGDKTKGSTGARKKDISRADAAAQALGYADYAGLHGGFTKIELMGFTLGRGLPALAQRVALADEWLKARYPLNKSDKERDTWQKVAQKDLGWNGNGAGAYSDTETDVGANGLNPDTNRARGAHFHALGLALDIDPKHNPWVFHGDNNAKGGANDRMAKHLRYAAQIYGGEAITAQQMLTWGEELSTEELFARVHTVSESLRQYLVLAETGSDDDIKSAFKDKAGFSDDDLKTHDIVNDVRKFGQNKKGFKRTWDYMGREKAESLTNMSLDMVIALRDVAGLSWGGTDMGDKHNGDFMHFDMRNTDAGQRLATFGNYNRATTDAANEAALEAEKKAKEQKDAAAGQ